MWCCIFVTNQKSKSDKPATEAKKPEKEAAKDEVPVTVLNLQVGFIHKAWKHPSADRYAGEFAMPLIP